MTPWEKSVSDLKEKVDIMTRRPGIDAETYVTAQLIFHQVLGKALMDKTIHKPISKALYETWRTLNTNERDRLERGT